MSDPNHELPHESDRLLRKVRELGELEMEKRTEQISSPRFHELARDVTQKSREIMYRAVEEEQVGNESHSTDESIDDVAAEDQKAG
ncbi:MAG TPA: hypothetical protein VGO64_08135 [Candidatus Limnocylindrales bacterium]|jgi:hypothetical protein|nr:hypothetical protein [Candidatus Limnocylindrales bacterium]